MTIFPTHKTQLKTKLSRQEILENFEHNNIYTLGFYYELKENGKSYILNPVRKENSRQNFAPIVNLKITEKYPYTNVSLSFLPIKTTGIMSLIFSIAFLVASAGFATHDFINSGFSLGSLLLYISIGLSYYIISFLKFSFEVLSIKKQIEEHINAGNTEISEEKMSKLQSWYEKERDPFKFKNK
mgnify:CR=1 FL=1